MKMNVARLSGQRVSRSRAGVDRDQTGRSRPAPPSSPSFSPKLREFAKVPLFSERQIAQRRDYLIENLSLNLPELGSISDAAIVRAQHVSKGPFSRRELAAALRVLLAQVRAAPGDELEQNQKELCHILVATSAFVQLKGRVLLGDPDHVTEFLLSRYRSHLIEDLSAREQRFGKCADLLRRHSNDVLGEVYTGQSRPSLLSTLLCAIHFSVAQELPRVDSINARAVRCRSHSLGQGYRD